jgi:serine/threonine-protein kinase
MVTGRSAFASDSVIATMSAILRDEPTPVRELAPNAPTGLAEIIDGCLRKDREERTQSIDEVRVALETLKKGYNPGASTTVARPADAAATRVGVPVPAQILRPPKKSPTLAYAIGAIGVLVAGAGGWWIATRNKSGPPAGQQAAAVTAPATPASVVSETVLTNDSITKMVEAKVRTSAILDHIRASKTNFNLSTDEVIRLSKAGVPDAVIQVMRDPAKAPAKADAASGPAPSPSKDAPGTPPAPAAPPPSASTLAVALADGLAISVQLTHDIPNDAKAGTPLKFQVAKDIVVDGSVVIAKGAQVKGSIAEESRKAVLTLKKMTYEFTDVEAVNRQKLKLRATPSGAAGPSRKAIEPGKKKVKDVASTAGTDYVAYLDGAQTVTMQR